MQPGSRVKVSGSLEGFSPLISGDGDATSHRFPPLKVGLPVSVPLLAGMGMQQNAFSTSIKLNLSFSPLISGDGDATSLDASCGSKVRLVSVPLLAGMGMQPTSPSWRGPKLPMFQSPY